MAERLVGPRPGGGYVGPEADDVDHPEAALRVLAGGSIGDHGSGSGPDDRDLGYFQVLAGISLYRAGGVAEETSGGESCVASVKR